jgi:hypothetical protein
MVRSTNHEARLYALFTTLPSLPPFSAQMPSQHPIFENPRLMFFLSFHNGMKQQAKLKIMRVLVFMFLDNKREDKDFGPNGNGLFWIQSVHT